MSFTPAVPVSVNGALTPPGGFGTVLKVGKRYSAVTEAACAPAAGSSSSASEGSQHKRCLARSPSRGGAVGWGVVKIRGEL